MYRCSSATPAGTTPPRKHPEWLIEGVRLAAAERLADSPVCQDRVRHAAEFLKASREHRHAQAEAEEQRREAELRTAQERREEAAARATPRKCRRSEARRSADQ